MRTLAAGSLVVLLVLAASAASATDMVPAPPRERPLLLRGAEVHTISGEVLSGHDVLIATDGTITAIGVALASADAEVIDLTGQILLPAFIAAQTSLGLTEISAVRATNDTTETGTVTPEAAAHLAFNPDSELIPTVRRNGIGIAQVAPTMGTGRGLLRGRSAVLRLDGWTKEDAGLRLTWGQQLRWPATGVRQGFFAPPEDEQKKLMVADREELERVFDAAAAYHRRRSASPDSAIDVQLEALRAVIGAEEPLFVLADDLRQIAEALEFTKRRGLELVLVGGGEAEVHAVTLVARNVPVVLDTVFSLPEHVDDAYDDPYTLPARLAAAGVRIAFANPGSSWDARNVPFAAGHAIGFGLDRAAAYRALTLEPATILGIADRVGSIEVGKEATLVAGRGDLLDPLSQEITLLLIHGRVVDLDNRHERLYRKYNERLKRLAQEN